jgi:hypothetical protein
MKESEVQRSILQYLAIKKVFHYRNNSGAIVSTYKGKERFMRFGALGSPDIICIIKGRFVGIEVKRPGGKQNPNQLQFQKDLEKAGGLYVLAYSLDDVIKNGI